MFELLVILLYTGDGSKFIGRCTRSVHTSILHAVQARFSGADTGNIKWILTKLMSRKFIKRVCRTVRERSIPYWSCSSARETLRPEDQSIAGVCAPKILCFVYRLFAFGIENCSAMTQIRLFFCATDGFQRNFRNKSVLCYLSSKCFNEFNPTTNGTINRSADVFVKRDTLDSALETIEFSREEFSRVFTDNRVKAKFNFYQSIIYVSCIRIYYGSGFWTSAG